MPACDERIALIADRGLTSQGPLLSLVEKLLVLGLGQVLLREKGLAEPDLLALAEPIQKACAEKGARFIVNSSFSV
ncbi:MAG: thiamine phosphate synthase, partial [Deltaproteobacteria bacterium]|nr:thiamine phosphate synthase [Deltaproteobacteria bacterium]